MTSGSSPLSMICRSVFADAVPLALGVTKIGSGRLIIPVGNNYGRPDVAHNFSGCILDSGRVGGVFVHRGENLRDLQNLNAAS